MRHGIKLAAELPPGRNPDRRAGRRSVPVQMRDREMHG